MTSDHGADDATSESFDTLQAEAKAAVAHAANTLRAVTQRYRETFHEDLARWHEDRDSLDMVDRRTLATLVPDPAPSPVETAAEDEAQATASQASGRLRRQIAVRTTGLGERQTELARLELVVRALERTWLFLERGDASLLTDPTAPDLPDDLQMRIVEAREAERTRLAQEVHDGPAQSLSNAIFGVEYISKLLERDPGAVPAELRFLRERLRRELGDVRAFISQLRPPLLDELGLDGSLRDTTTMLTSLTGIPVELDLTAPPELLGDPQQVVVLRVLQEAVQNIRKHAGARHVWLTTRLVDDRWIMDVRDDGRGFDMDAVGVRGRGNFGLQFMRERAEIVRGRLEIRSRPANGTVVLLDIPVGERGDRL